MGNVCVRECYCNSVEEEDDEIFFFDKQQKDFIIIRLSQNEKTSFLFT